MTLEVRTAGSIFDSGADVLVNPVNCVGVSGKGLALEFKRRFPDANADYEERAHYGHFIPGRCYPILNQTTEQILYYFTTKEDWRNPSQLLWIWSGLIDMTRLLTSDVVIHGQKVAVPALGCGLGGLKWEDVWTYLYPVTQVLDHIHWIIYPPQEGE